MAHDLHQGSAEADLACGPCLSVAVPVCSEQLVLADNTAVHDLHQGSVQEDEENSASGLRLSVAVPVYNEELVLPEFLNRLQRVLAQVPGGPHEMVFVDDGSRDGTLGILERAAAEDPRVVLVSLSRNFGHATAITAALDHVSGDATIVMDADLQDAPEAIPRLVGEYLAGNDIVYAVRASRKDSWWLRVCYFLAYRIIAFFSDLPLALDAGDFSLLSRRAVETLRSIPERKRYMRGLRSWVGFRQVGVSIERDKRFAGHSKYTLSKLVLLAADGIFSFSIAPLRMAAVVGFLVIVLSSVFLAYAIFAWLFLDTSPPGFTSLIGTVTLLSGVQLLSLGIVGEYVGRVYEEVKARPKYVIQKLIRNA